MYDGWMGARAMPDAARLAALVPEVPPQVFARGLVAGTEGYLTAALLAWGRSDTGWMAGLCFPFTLFRGSALSALLTAWVPAVQVHQRPGDVYAGVPRVVLSGPPAAWPDLPGRHPGVGADWLARHLHAPAVDPAGEYRDLRDTIRRL
jgi:hypothetical protein